jgi:hypothetical protein
VGRWAPKYPVKWTRNSGLCCYIEQMNDFHLVSAYRRVLRAQKDFQDGISLDPVKQADALPHLLAEMTQRGLDPKWKYGKAPEDEPPAIGDSVPEME